MNDMTASQREVAFDGGLVVRVLLRKSFSKLMNVNCNQSDNTPSIFALNEQDCKRLVMKLQC